MKGSMTEFLQLAADNPELVAKLVKLAAEYGFEFTGEEMSEEELGKVAGGLDDLQLQSMMQRTTKFTTTLSNVLKSMSDSQTSITGNLK